MYPFGDNAPSESVYPIVTFIEYLPAIVLGLAVTIIFVLGFWYGLREMDKDTNRIIEQMKRQRERERDWLFNKTIEGKYEVIDEDRKWLE